MDTPEIERLRFPIGRFTPPEAVAAAQRPELISHIEQLPANMRAAVKGLTDDQFNTPYREGGWTVRQVAHHVPDSHMNGYLRFKLALTEDAPAVINYQEARFAELPDTSNTPVAVSLAILDALHPRWVSLLRSMSDADFAREYIHPKLKIGFRLDTALALYAWHSRHHVAHITTLRDRMGW